MCPEEKDKILVGESKLSETPKKPQYPVTKTRFVYDDAGNSQHEINKKLWKAFQNQIITSGTTTIGSDGYWYVDGEKTEIKAVGENGKDADVWAIGEDSFWYLNGQKTKYKSKGEDGKSPILRLSKDGMSIEISSDGGETWLPFINDFNKLRVIGYVDSVDLLPRNANIGDIYGVWNPDVYSGRVDEEGHLIKGAYDLYINTVKDWIEDYTITRVYDYDTELPASANDGTTVLVPVTYLTLDKEKIDGYKVYRFSLENDGWTMILNTAEIYASKNDIINYGDNIYALVQGVEPHTYVLYKRKAGWVFFGTNASITYKLVQYVEDGTTTNILSGQAVKNAIEEIYDIYGRYEENPEFVRVYLDNEGKVLWGIRTDGSIYYGAGIPPQVKEYVDTKVKELSPEGYGDIINFLDGIEFGSKTLQTLLNEKVDKEEGKSLIDAEYASSHSTIENPEYLEVTTDSEDKVLEGIQTDGTKVIGGDLNVGGSAKILGSMEVSGVSYKVIENPEYLAAWVDAEDKVIFGLKTDGKTYVGDADFLNAIKDNQEAIAEINTTLATVGAKVDSLDLDALSSIITIENPEYIEAIADSEGKLLAGRTTDGTAFEKVGFSAPIVTIDGHSLRNIKDIEGRTEILTDNEGKIISYRGSDGIKHENVGIAAESFITNHLNLSNSGMTEFQQALKDSGFTSGQGDWSDYISNDGDKPLHLPTPKCAMINLLTDFNLINLSKVGRTGAQQGVNYDIPVEVEFWDMQGNYFKKWTLISGQGNSTMSFDKKNIAMDFFDTSVYDKKGRLGKGDAFKVKFGDWPAFDSFHLKANINDTFRVVNQLSYSFYDKMSKSRGIKDDYAWKRSLIDFNNIGIGSFVSKTVASNSLETGAKCFPDGFPVIVYQQGEFWGIFFFSIKKHRDNYHLKKSSSNNIHLDGLLDDESIFMANGDIDWSIFCGRKSNWNGKLDGIEVRNPKDLICIDPEYSYVLVDSSSAEYTKITNSQQYGRCTENLTTKTDAEIRELYGSFPSAYMFNISGNNELYRIEESYSGKYASYDADICNHELIDDSMSCYLKKSGTNTDLDPNDEDDAKMIKKHQTSNAVKHYIEDFSRVMTTINIAKATYEASEQTAEDLATLKDVFETYFDVKNLIDYIIHGDITFNWDGFAGKNWQWFTYNGVKWYCGVYDCDATFGYVNGSTMSVPPSVHTCQHNNSHPTHTLLMNKYILDYYNDELEARYKELRDSGIIDAANITDIAADFINTIGKDMYDKEWGKWDENMPKDSIYRLMNWLTSCISNMDSTYNYNV